jgi:hypothetical protein
VEVQFVAKFLLRFSKHNTTKSEREIHHMSLPLRKRTVHFYEIHVHARAKLSIQNPSCAPLPELLKRFASLATENRLPQTIRKSSNLHTVLSDWSYDARNNCYEVLISKANAALSDVALRDLGTKKLRLAGKTKVEGIEISAHILILPNVDGKTATVLMTMGAGVAAKDIEVLLLSMSRLAAKQRSNKDLYWFDEPSGAKDAKGKALQYQVHYRFAAQAHMGQTLAAALQSGEFESMDLIAPLRSQFDSGGNLQITERSLSVHANLPKTVTGASIRNAIRSFRTQPDGNTYSKLRIHYKTIAGKHTSATLDLNNLDAAFTLKEQIEFDTDVQAQQESLCPAIVDGMKSLLQSLPI